MAYPILNSLTHDTADKIESLISHSEIMTRGKYSPKHLASAHKPSNIPRNSAKLFATMLKTSADSLTMSMTLRAMWELT